MDSLICLSNQCPHAWLATLDVVRLCMAAFIAILFLQSGLDKVVDRKGNVEWLTGHFANSPLASQVIPMLGVITVVEISAGALSALGFLVLLFTGNATVAAWGAFVSLVALLMLFFGQRLAKDYAGAAILVPYFLVSSVALWLMGS